MDRKDTNGVWCLVVFVHGTEQRIWGSHDALSPVLDAFRDKQLIRMTVTGHCDTADHAPVTVVFDMEHVDVIRFYRESGCYSDRG